MAKLSASKAAKEVGVSIPTITRAIAKGKLSAVPVTDINGGKGYEIETSELFRVFPPKQVVTAETGTEFGSATPVQNRVLEVEIKMLRERLVEKDAVISDLRADRDAWKDQADRATSILASPAAQERPRRPWWHFGRQNG